MSVCSGRKESAEGGNLESNSGVAELLGMVVEGLEDLREEMVRMRGGLTGIEEQVELGSWRLVGVRYNTALVGRSINELITLMEILTKALGPQEEQALVAGIGSLRVATGVHVEVEVEAGEMGVDEEMGEPEEDAEVQGMVDMD